MYQAGPRPFCICNKASPGSGEEVPMMAIAQRLSHGCAAITGPGQRPQPGILPVSGTVAA